MAELTPSMFKTSKYRSTLKSFWATFAWTRNYFLLDQSTEMSLLQFQVTAASAEYRNRLIKPTFIWYPLGWAKLSTSLLQAADLKRL